MKYLINIFLNNPYMDKKYYSYKPTGNIIFLKISLPGIQHFFLNIVVMKTQIYIIIHSFCINSDELGL